MRANVLKLKPRPPQNSFCRMPLLKNSDTNSLNLGSRLPPSYDYRLFSLFIPPLQHRLLLWNRCVARTRTNVGEH